MSATGSEMVGGWMDDKRWMDLILTDVRERNFQEWLSWQPDCWPRPFTAPFQLLITRILKTNQIITSDLEKSI